ncbi:MAG: hypothetical protein H9W81_07365 [Enterococcus sp.]|nr:hypothetical protein [Enterococcus sp.]
MVAGLASVLLFTSACAGDDEPDTATATAEATVSATASPSATAETAGSEYGPTIDGMPTMKELAKDKNGVWRKTTILPDDPAFELTDSVAMEPNVREMWSEEEIEEAHRIAVNMAVDTIDTSGNGALDDTDSMEKWWEANKDKFAPEWQEEIRVSVFGIDKNQTAVYKAPHRQHDDPALDYGLVYGEDKVHVKDRQIKTTAIQAGELNGKTAIRVDLEVTFFNVVNVDGKEDIEGVGASMAYTLVKDEASGKLLVSGISNTFSTQPIR